MAALPTSPGSTTTPPRSSSTTDRRGTDRGPTATTGSRKPARATRPAFERPVRVKDVMFPLGEGAVRPRLLHRAVDHGIPGLQLRGRRGRRARRAVPQEPDVATSRSDTACTTPATPCSARRTARRPARRTRPACPTASRPRPSPRQLVDDRKPAARPTRGCRTDATTTERQQLHRLRRPERPRRLRPRRRRRAQMTAPRTFDYSYDHAQAGQRPEEPADQPGRDVLPRELAARPLVRGGLRRGRRATPSRTTSAAAASAATRSWPRATTSAAPTTPTCRRRPTAPARGCRCSSSTGRTRCPAGPATTRR